MGTHLRSRCFSSILGGMPAILSRWQNKSPFRYACPLPPPTLSVPALCLFFASSPLPCREISSLSRCLSKPTHSYSSPDESHHPDSPFCLSPGSASSLSPSARKHSSARATPDCVPVPPTPPLSAAHHASSLHSLFSRLYGLSSMPSACSLDALLVSSTPCTAAAGSSALSKANTEPHVSPHPTISGQTSAQVRAATLGWLKVKLEEECAS